MGLSSGARNQPLLSSRMRGLRRGGGRRTGLSASLEAYWEAWENNSRADSAELRTPGGLGLHLLRSFWTCSVYACAHSHMCRHARGQDIRILQTIFFFNVEASMGSVCCYFPGPEENNIVEAGEFLTVSWCVKKVCLNKNDRIPTGDW